MRRGTIFIFANIILFYFLHTIFRALNYVVNTYFANPANARRNTSVSIIILGYANQTAPTNCPQSITNLPAFTSIYGVSFYSDTVHPYFWLECFATSKAAVSHVPLGTALNDTRELAAITVSYLTSISESKNCF